MACIILTGAVRGAEVNEFAAASDAKHIDTTITAFMQKYDVPGLSFALSKDGKILFAKGYGFANRESRAEVTPEHPFRIASVAKPITAITIMKLVEMKQLSLDDKVFGSTGILGKTYPTSDKHLLQVTVRHLLEHGVGPEWGNNKNDPMFMKPDYSHRKLINWVLETRKLTNAPGTSYNYSNLGYCVLGRVIETATGRTYEDAVQNLFRRHGIKSLELAFSKRSRSVSVVVYYAQGKGEPYGMRLERMDAHGGWQATAVDLVKLMLVADGKPEVPDIISAESAKIMTTAGAHNKNYALGWAVNKHNNWWHMGSLPGTASIIVRADNGMCWAVLLNTRSTAPAFTGDLDRMPWDVVRGIKNWPAKE
jgi:CubicO group peptidase (beta-lactamase class C family)